MVTWKTPEKNRSYKDYMHAVPVNISVVLKRKCHLSNALVDKA